MGTLESLSFMEIRLLKYDLVDKMKESVSLQAVEMESSLQVTGDKNAGEHLNGEHTLQPRDIICAFNYSCCCLHRRADLLTYFRHVLHTLFRKGGIFVMDLYGGASSERHSGFKGDTQILLISGSKETLMLSVEQQELVYTSISPSSGHDGMHLHITVVCNWTLPDIKDCLEEVGFRSVHFWIRGMPDTSQNALEYRGDDDMKYKEVSTFCQRDAWNAFVVGIVGAKC